MSKINQMSRVNSSVYLFPLIFITVLVCTLALAAPAFAWTHGQFTATTDACAGCHVAHASRMAKLLKVGPTQTHFCFLCHGDGAASAPYDVEDGYTTAGSGVYPSTAGGFVRQFVDADGDGVIDSGELKGVTSRHNVWGFVYGEENTAVADTTDKYFWIPGGSTQFTGDGFVCASCHDPHAGGRTPDASGYIAGSATAANPRLLRRTVTVQDAAYTDLYVSFKFATVGTFTYQGVSSGVYWVTGYQSGSTRWCGACHNKFKTAIGDDGTIGPGHATQYFGMWRHPMDVHAVLPAGADGSLATGTPLETGTSGVAGTPDYVACLTCHRAHSSTAAVGGWAASWPRDAADPATGKTLGDTSALLRMDSRGICYNCHGAGQYNCWNDTRVNCSSCHSVGSHSGFDNSAACTFCHR